MFLYEPCSCVPKRVSSLLPGVKVCSLSLSLTIALCVPFMILLQTQGVSAQTILDAYIWQMRQTLENLCRIKSAKKMHVYSIKTNKEVAKQQTTNSV